MSNDSLGKILFVATTVCVVCSIVVSSAAVLLKPRQEANKILDVRKNILKVSGLLDGGEDGADKIGRLSREEINDLFEKEIKAKVVDLATGEYVADIDPAEFDVKKEARDPDTSTTIPEEYAAVGLPRRPNRQVVYLLEKDGKLERLILPIYGKGLWSTMYGLIALDSDLNTVKSISFYDHGETPGLGGEIEKDKFTGSWKDKKVYDNGGPPVIRVIKGSVDADAPGAIHEVDGISGATLTCNGVTHTVDFWLGPDGFGPYLDKLKGGK